MKHRSVIAFVIVVAALFAAPQLSHDLRSFKGAVGSRLHHELLHAFLNLPAAEAAVSPEPSPAQTLLASCTKGSANAPAAKADRSPRVDARANEKQVEQRAMITDPGNDPVVGQVAGLKNVAARAAAFLPEVKAETEVAMIIPPDSAPDSGVGPEGLASLLESRSASLEDAKHLREQAEGVRVALTGARFEMKGAQWQKAADEAVRSLNVPGTYEFRIQREGSKVRVLKFNKCSDCPAPAPRAPRQAAKFAPLPSAAFAPVSPFGE